MLPLRTTQLRVSCAYCGIFLFTSPPGVIGQGTVARPSIRVDFEWFYHFCCPSTTTRGVPNLFFYSWANPWYFHTAYTPRQQGLKIVMKSGDFYNPGFYGTNLGFQLLLHKQIISISLYNLSVVEWFDNQVFYRGRPGSTPGHKHLQILSFFGGHLEPMVPCLH